MTQAAIEYEIKSLEALLRHVTRFDLWNLWSYEKDRRLEYLKAKLEAMKI